MNPRQRVNSGVGIGTIIGMCILIIEAGVDLYTGKITVTQLYTTLLLCAFLGVCTVFVAKRIIRKHRGR